MADRYTALTQVLADRGYGSGATTAATATADVASGRAEFNSRVDAALAARRITRTQGPRLKADYAAAVQLESRHLCDGAITAAERDDLDARLDALDAKLGDSGSPGANLTPRARLDAIARTLPASGLTRGANAQILVELGDLTRLADAYARTNTSIEEQAYLNRRVEDVETRVRQRP